MPRPSTCYKCGYVGATDSFMRRNASGKVITLHHKSVGHVENLNRGNEWIEKNSYYPPKLFCPQCGYTDEGTEEDSAISLAYFSGRSKSRIASEVQDKGCSIVLFTVGLGVGLGIYIIRPLIT
jgi:hypothetical protein